MCDSEETFYEDERRLKNSGVRNVFTPHTPINLEVGLMKCNKYCPH